MTESGSTRIRRLSEELEENGLRLEGDETVRDILMEELDHALHPPRHERRIASGGTIIEPESDSANWESGTQLRITRSPLSDQPLPAARRFADGFSSWLLRRTDGEDELIVFDRPAGSERDLLILASVLEATIVQRHSAGSIRIVGRFGVLRWEAFRWHHEPPVRTWTDALNTSSAQGHSAVLKAMLEFAVHDLGSQGVGALLIYRPEEAPGPPVEELLPAPPTLRIDLASHLAPLRHALAQVDGAAVFDIQGMLRQLGVRLVPSRASEKSVEALGGTRHTSGRRYSHDDPLATVIVVSEDGPVTVFRNGAVLGRSPSVD